MYLETENQELLELLSLVKATEDDPSTGSHLNDSPKPTASVVATPATAAKTLHDYHAVSTYAAAATAASGAKSSSSTPFDQLDKVLRRGTPTPTHPLLSATATKAVATGESVIPPPIAGSILMTSNSLLNSTGDLAGGFMVSGGTAGGSTIFPPHSSTPQLGDAFQSALHMGSFGQQLGHFTSAGAGGSPLIRGDIHPQQQPFSLASSTAVTASWRGASGGGGGGGLWDSTRPCTTPTAATIEGVAITAANDHNNANTIATEPRRLGTYTLSHTLFSGAAAVTTTAPAEAGAHGGGGDAGSRAGGAATPPTSGKPALRGESMDELRDGVGGGGSGFDRGSPFYAAHASSDGDGGGGFVVIGSDDAHIAAACGNGVSASLADAFSSVAVESYGVGGGGGHSPRVGAYGFRPLTSQRQQQSSINAFHREDVFNAFGPVPQDARVSHMPPQQSAPELSGISPLLMHSPDTGIATPTAPVPTGSARFSREGHSYPDSSPFAASDSITGGFGGVSGGGCTLQTHQQQLQPSRTVSTNRAAATSAAAAAAAITTPNHQRQSLSRWTERNTAFTDPTGHSCAPLYRPRSGGGRAHHVALCSPDARTITPAHGSRPATANAGGGHSLRDSGPRTTANATRAESAISMSAASVNSTRVRNAGGGVDSEPQPSLRPQPPQSKYVTPLGGQSRADGSGSLASTGKAKLNHFTLPSPPRPFIGITTGSMCGGGGGGAPCIRTQEGPDMGFQGGASTQLSSIAGRLSGDGGMGVVSSNSNTAVRRPHGVMSRVDAGFTSNSANNTLSLAGVPPAGPVSLSPVAPLLLSAATATATAASGNGRQSPMDTVVAAHVLTLCRDQHGCRQLQNILTKEILAPTTAENRETFAESFRQFEMAYAAGGNSGGTGLTLTDANNSGTCHEHGGGFDHRRVGGNGGDRSSMFDASTLSEAGKEKNYHASLLIGVIVRAVQKNFSLVMSDAYGNFLVQKIFDIAPSRERVNILSGCSSSGGGGGSGHSPSPPRPQMQRNTNGFCDNIVAIACSPHGTFALQRLIETIRSDAEESLIFSAMFPPRPPPQQHPQHSASGTGYDAMMKLFTDANGGHVLGKMTTYLKNRYGRLSSGSSNNQNHSGNSKSAGMDAGVSSGGGTRTGVVNAGKIYERLHNFYDFLVDHLFYICTHRQGCCVVQKCIDFFADVFSLSDGGRPGNSPVLSLAARADTASAIDASASFPVNCSEELASRIIALTPELAVNPFGNYVITHLIEVCFLKGSYTHVREIFTHISRRIFFFCQNKFASNVVEKTLRHVSEDDVRAVCVSLMDVPTASELAGRAAAAADATATPVTASGMGMGNRARVKSKLELLALDPYGNYVVQTLLGTAPVDLLISITSSSDEDDDNAGNEESNRNATAASYVGGSRASSGVNQTEEEGNRSRRGGGGGGRPTGMLWQLQQVVPEIREKNLGKKIITKMELAMLRVREQQKLD